MIATFIIFCLSIISVFYVTTLGGYAGLNAYYLLGPRIHHKKVLGALASEPFEFVFGLTGGIIACSISNIILYYLNHHSSFSICIGIYVAFLEAGLHIHQFFFVSEQTPT